MASLQVEYPPAAEPITLTDAKNFLRVSISDDDTLISDLIQTARELAEAWTGRSLVNKGYRQSLDAFPYFTDTTLSQLAYPPSYYSLPRYSTTLWNYSQMIKLFRSPLRFITRISYQDSKTGTTQQLYAALPNWQALTESAIADEIEDSNGNVQVVSAVSESEEDKSSITGANQPAWATAFNATTTDGDITWTNKGAAPTPNFLFDRDSEPPRIFPLAGGFWPAVLYVPQAVEIHYVAGYGNDSSSLPATARTLVRQLVAQLYEYREPVSRDAVKEIPAHLENLVWSLRVLDFAPTRG